METMQTFFDLQTILHLLANTQYVARWDKSGKREKSGRPPTFLPSLAPSNHPSGLYLMY